jgi:hypothetical protein
MEQTVPLITISQKNGLRAGSLKVRARRSRAMVNPFDPKTALLAKHAQHVVLIHFPIALFITAVAFDFLAQWRKSQTGRRRLSQLTVSQDFDGASGGVRACGVAMGAGGATVKGDSPHAPHLGMRLKRRDLADLVGALPGAAAGGGLTEPPLGA